MEIDFLAVWVSDTQWGPWFSRGGLAWSSQTPRSTKPLFLLSGRGLGGEAMAGKCLTPLCRVMPFILTGMSMFLLLSALFSISPGTVLFIYRLGANWTTCPVSFSSSLIILLNVIYVKCKTSSRILHTELGTNRIQIIGFLKNKSDLNTANQCCRNAKHVKLF